jgi:SAM-dependent methyltransferase
VRVQSGAPAPLLPDDPSSYAFDNAWALARQRLTTLEQWLDPGTTDIFEAIGIDEGWTCLEVGAGGGSVATWLARRVGPGGHAVATDLNPRFLVPMNQPNLEVRQHNILTEELPEAAFDLAHARLVLAHLPTPQIAVQRMVASLKPGGWFVDEELDFCSLLPVSASEAGNALFTRLMEAHHHVLRLHDFDVLFGRRLLGLLEAADLTHIETAGRSALWHGGSVFARALQLTFLQLGEEILSKTDVTERDLTDMDEMLDDPSFTVVSQLVVAAWGQRPAGL